MVLKQLDEIKTQEGKLDFIRKNKGELIEAKKAIIKHTDNLMSDTILPEAEKKSLIKAEGDTPSEDAPFDVTVVCNTANFCDSMIDVILEGAYTNSIKKRGTSIPHIADHEYESTAHVGDVTKVYTAKLPVKSLGYNAEGDAEVLLMDSTIRKDYNDKVYTFYKSGKINQHSIGLRYTQIELALNSQVDEDKAEYEVWQKYYPSIINKEVVDKTGYFWAVPEIDVRENSCVLFGANSLTPTLTITNVKSELTQLPKEGKKVYEIKSGENTMTIEELQAALLKSQSEVLQLKNDLATATSTAIKAEQDRILGIQKAAETLGIKSSLDKIILAGTDVASATTMFEIIKESTQKENPSPKGEGLDASLNDKNTPKADETKGDKPEGLAGVLEGFKALETAQNIFAEVK